MPLISTFGAASARAFGLQAGSKEEPGSWFAPQGQDLTASYEPAGYASVTITIVGVNGGSGYGGNNKKWTYESGTENQPTPSPGNKVGKASKVSGSVSPANLAFRTVQADVTNQLNTRGWTSGSAANNYSGSQAKHANQGIYSGTNGGGATVAYHGNTRIAVAAGGGASGRQDRNTTNAYNALSNADSSNNNVTNSNNGTNTTGGACYYTSGGSGGGEKGGATTTAAANKGGYSGNSYSTGLTLTAGAFQDRFIGSTEDVGYAKVEWS